jgi:hypothetical protein
VKAICIRKIDGEQKIFLPADLSNLPDQEAFGSSLEATSEGDAQMQKSDIYGS